ncbi:uncharacterized protein LOC129728358 [Wyeomyia smithii]|uniref:uncharacterized protein LOC129728358 n=1 Tax=Wyeomyia smithii TaxID=174621 RepID=UPI002467B170|nr:uncharacterized protein LOC129728358 [Wyeomyia smithii]
MVFLCCIPICKNAKSGADQSVGFHPFPLITEQREKWIEFVGADATKFRWRGKFICSEHFLHSELMEENDQKKLLDGAVPMIFSQEECEEDDFFDRDDFMISKEVVTVTTSSNTAHIECREMRKLFCRLCLTKQSNLLPFTSKLHNVTLTDIIYTIAGVKIETNPLMPTQICTGCVSKLDLAFNVRIEVIHNNKRVTNLFKNQQLQYHYKFFDKHQFNTKSVNHDYLADLLEAVKQQKEAPGIVKTIGNNAPSMSNLVVTYEDPVKQECVSSSQTKKSEDVFEDNIEEEHLFEEEDFTDNIGELQNSIIEQKIVSQGQLQNEPFVEHQNSANRLKQEAYSDSDDESDSGKPKFVFSWKELYTPKEEPKPKRSFDPKPKPNLIPFTCYTCKISMKDANELEIHLEKHVDLLPFTCKECATAEHSMVFKSLYALNKHLESHLYPYKCEHCPCRFLNGHSYLKHLSNHHESHNDGFTCDYCGQYFTKKPPFQRHIAKHRAMEEGKFTCEYCGRAFNCNPLLRRHRRIHTGEKPYECRKCGKRFNHAANFQNHKRIHTGERAYRCTECDKAFMCSTTLRYHMASHYPDDPKYRIQASVQRPRYSVTVTDNNGIKEYKCDVPDCDFSTRLYRAHFYHRSMHRKRFECEICHKRFPLRANLKKHVAVAHEGKQEPKDKPCPYCPKKFSCRQKLSIHIDVHENNRRHKCRFCEKSFVQKVNCTAHEKIHTGERPHKCRFCDAAFISSSGKKKHEKTHQEYQQIKQETEDIPENTIAEEVNFDTDKETGYYVEVEQDDGVEDLVEYAPVIQQGRFTHIRKTNTSDSKDSIFELSKYLIGVTPGGSISYVRSGYGGKSSDKQIVIEEGVSDRLAPGQAVTTDKGFMIDDECKRRYVKLLCSVWYTSRRAFCKETYTMAAKICRLCLRQSTEVVPLFQACIGDKLLIEMIWSTFRIEIDKKVIFPKVVCNTCIKKVEFMHSFKQELTNCQSLLLNWKSNKTITKRRLALADLPSYYSDGILELQEQDDEITQQNTDECMFEVERLEPEMDIEKIENEEILREHVIEEQLIGIKIEALQTNNQFIEHRMGDDESSVVQQPDQYSDCEEEFKGFEEPVPVKLEVVKRSDSDYRQRKSKQAIPKLKIIETIANKCYICGTVYESKLLFDIHLVSHKLMLPYKCDKCSTDSFTLEIKTLVLLNKHFESHGFNYTCSYCPLRFRSYPPLYDHTRNAHTQNSEGFTCDICGQKFLEVRKFRKHARAHRNCATQRYKCKNCFKNFQTGTILRRHERIHAEEKPFKCPFCNRGFNHETNYNQHKMRHIQQQSDDLSNYACELCENHYTNAIDFRVHMAEHYPDNPLYTVKTDILPKHLKDSSSYPRPCEEPNCQYVALSYQLMWSHYRNHYKLYKCQECDRMFATATILRRHIDVVHQKVRKYQCEFCQKAFAYQHKYKEHVNMHKGIKTRQCRYCAKCFTHSSNLMIHERIHTKIRPYECTTCGSSYVSSSALKKHQKTHQPKPSKRIDRNSKARIKKEEVIVPDLIYVIEKAEAEDEKCSSSGFEEVVEKIEANEILEVQ